MFKKLVASLLAVVLAVMTAVCPAMGEEPIELEPGVFLYMLQPGFDYEEDDLYTAWLQPDADEERTLLAALVTLDMMLQPKTQVYMEFFNNVLKAPGTIYLMEPESMGGGFKIVYYDGNSMAEIQYRKEPTTMTFVYYSTYTTDMYQEMQDLLDAGLLGVYYEINPSDILEIFESASMSITIQ
ncbi:MAG: hypothetical protein ACI4ME_11360 [Aristaeellaceae bacterium]